MTDPESVHPEPEPAHIQEPTFVEVRREMLELADVDVLELLGGAHP